MLNEELLLDPKDHKIAELTLKVEKLTKAIQSFKQYDRKRTKYYRDAMIRLGMLESEYAEDSNGLRKKLQNYKKEISNLQKKVVLSKIAELTDIELNKNYNKQQYLAEIRALKTEVANLKKLRDELIWKLNSKNSPKKIFKFIKLLPFIK